eukprot:Skav231556  [mRNA]  locus=scaffold481:60848:66510:- [translate_table: standard]
MNSERVTRQLLRSASKQLEEFAAEGVGLPWGYRYHEDVAGFTGYSTAIGAIKAQEHANLLWAYAEAREWMQAASVRQSKRSAGLTGLPPGETGQRMVELAQGRQMDGQHGIRLDQMRKLAPEHIMLLQVANRRKQALRKCGDQLAKAVVEGAASSKGRASTGLDNRKAGQAICSLVDKIFGGLGGYKMVSERKNSACSISWHVPGQSPEAAALIPVISLEVRKCSEFPSGFFQDFNLETELLAAVDTLDRVHEES